MDGGTDVTKRIISPASRSINSGVYSNFWRGIRELNYSSDWLHKPRDPCCNIQLQTSFFKPKGRHGYEAWRYPLSESEAASYPWQLHVPNSRILLHMSYCCLADFCIPISYKDRQEHISCRSHNQSLYVSSLDETAFLCIGKDFWCSWNGPPKGFL